MRRQNLSRIALVPGAIFMAVASMGAAGCNLHSLKAVELEKAQEDERTLQLQVNKDVDILFVIDNSGSMGDEQGKLAANFPAFISVLEEEDVDANYRIGVTTTDNGNVECSGTSPEGGTLRLTSCTTRQDEFTWPKVNPTVMAYDVACGDVCPDAVGSGLSVIPTATANDPQEKPRPWIERIEGVSNIEGADTTQAFQCYGPQGVDGCGFEAQLESMYKAISRAKTGSENQFDFLRETAILAVVHVTDEADCSANESQQALVFDRNLPEADKVFWADPTSNIPTSAICWNAGVKCQGSGGIYSECNSQDYAEDGSEIGGNAGDNAVLRPVSRYINQLQTIEDEKKNFNTSQEVIVALLGGVPNNYESGMANLTYQDSTDPTVQTNFGIDYGCTSTGSGMNQQSAVPPVRLREFAESFNTADDGTRNIYSICADDYSGALRAVADAIKDQVRPGCYEKCVKDTDESTPAILDADCTVIEQDGESGQKNEVPECNGMGQLPSGADVCYITKTGKPAEGEKPAQMGVQMADVCIMDGWNLEFEIVRDPTKPPPGGTSVSATCQLSDFPEIDCPNL